jgi:hypothetical protein
VTTAGTGDERPAARLYALLVDPDEEQLTDGLSAEVEHALPANALRQVAATALQRIGDLVVDPKTVLAWLLTSLGAPAAVLALLVPVRESGSLLPQAGLVGVVRRRAVRKWLWVVGALVQAACVAVMALIAATASGAAAGWGILATLALFALARSLSSIASKDVLGRTIPKGARGRINGAATMVSGLVAITVGVGLRLLGPGAAEASWLALLLGAGALAWVAAGAVYATIAEPAGVDGNGDGDGGRGAALALLRDDPVFRRFVAARGLLLVSALSPPFLVALATTAGSTGLAGLGPFVISSGIAALIGGRAWGRIADRSSRLTMMLAAGSASTIVIVLLAALRFDAVREAALVYPAAYLLLALVHTGTRIGRKTYIVDMAEGDDRTARVAVSNAAMGVLLLVTGAITGAVATFGPEAALALLAALGLVGVVVSRSLPEVAAGH